MEPEEVPFPQPAEGQAWREWLVRRLPVLRWAPRYSRTLAVADAVAGVTLGLTLVPQSIAYASLANLPVQYGLYSAFIGTMLYVVLGTVKEVSIGPTSLMALLTLHACRGLPIDFVVLLTFLSGCLVLLMGLLRLGFLVELISPAVTSGFTSATAVIIVVAQVKGLLGLSFVAESPAENLLLIARHWRRVRLPDCALAAACCMVLLLLRKVKDIPVSARRPRLRKLLWLVSIARNALVVLTASGVAGLLHDPAQPLFKLSGKVEPGLPKFGLPPFSTTIGNRTVGFGEMVERLAPGLAVLPFVMVLANTAIAKAFTVGGRVDAVQEMVTLGVCNCVGALVGAMPTCGAFTRSAVSHSSGVRTPAAGLYAGTITLLALNYLTQYFFFIPKACLSSVLICAVIFMIDLGTVRRLWGSSRRELGVVLLTFVVGVGVSVEAAVLGGALASVAALLRDLLRPPRLLLVTDKASGSSALRVVPRRALVYLNVEPLVEKIHTALAGSATLADSAALAGSTELPLRAVLVDCSALALLDHTAEQALGRLVKALEAEGRHLVLYGAGPEVLRALRRVPGADMRALPARSAAHALALTAAPLPIPQPAPLPAPPPTLPALADALPLLDKSPAAQEKV